MPSEMSTGSRAATAVSRTPKDFAGKPRHDKNDAPQESPRAAPRKHVSPSPFPSLPPVMHPALAALLKGRKEILFPLADPRQPNTLWASAADLQTRLDRLAKDCQAGLSLASPNDVLADSINDIVATGLDQLQAVVDAALAYEQTVQELDDPLAFARAVDEEIRKAGDIGYLTVPVSHLNAAVKETVRLPPAEPLPIPEIAVQQPATRKIKIKIKPEHEHEDFVQDNGRSIRRKTGGQVLPGPLSYVPSRRATVPPNTTPPSSSSSPPIRAVTSSRGRPRSGRGSRGGRGGRIAKATAAAAATASPRPIIEPSTPPDSTPDLAISTSGKGKSSFSPQAVEILSNWLQQNLENPYATDDQKFQLSKETGLNIDQVSLWLTNARRRKLPGMRASSVSSDSSSQEVTAQPTRRLSSSRLTIPKAGPEPTNSTSPEIVTPTIEAAEIMLALEREARVGSEELSDDNVEFADAREERAASASEAETGHSRRTSGEFIDWE